jgi:hypothetical protein
MFLKVTPVLTIRKEMKGFVKKLYSIRVMLSLTVVLKDKFDNSRNFVFSEVKVMSIKIISRLVPSSFMISLTLVDELAGK